MTSIYKTICINISDYYQGKNNISLKTIINKINNNKNEIIDSFTGNSILIYLFDRYRITYKLIDIIKTIINQCKININHTNKQNHSALLIYCYNIFVYTNNIISFDLFKLLVNNKTDLQLTYNGDTVFELINNNYKIQNKKEWFDLLFSLNSSKSIINIVENVSDLDDILIYLIEFRKEENEKKISDIKMNIETLNYNKSIKQDELSKLNNQIKLLISKRDNIQISCSNIDDQIFEYNNELSQIGKYSFEDELKNIKDNYRKKIINSISKEEIIEIFKEKLIE